MIKINLLPVRAAKKKETLRQQISIAIMSLVAVLIVIGYADIGIRGKVSDVTAKIEAANAELIKTKAIIGEVSKFKEAKKAVEDKLGVLETLRKGKVGPVKMLDELSSLTPEFLWLNGYKEKDGKISLDGNSIGNEVIAQFMTALEKSENFKEVELVETSQVEQAGLKLKKFTLTMKLKAAAVGAAAAKKP